MANLTDFLVRPQTNKTTGKQFKTPVWPITITGGGGSRDGGGKWREMELGRLYEIEKLLYNKISSHQNEAATKRIREMLVMLFI